MVCGDDSDGKEDGNDRVDSADGSEENSRNGDDGVIMVKTMVLVTVKMIVCWRWWW